jgi:hypothetical protein
VGVGHWKNGQRLQGRRHFPLKFDVSPADFTIEFSAPEERVVRTGTPQVDKQATPEITKMLVVLDGELSRKEIMRRLDLKDVNHFRDAY